MENLQCELSTCETLPDLICWFTDSKFSSGKVFFFFLKKIDLDIHLIKLWRSG
jgi:hypothetical protein